jgi:hypothetical protein
MKLIKTVKGEEHEMQCSEEQAEVLLKDSRYRKADDNSAADQAAKEAAEKEASEAPRSGNAFQGNNRR